MILRYLMFGFLVRLAWRARWLIVGLLMFALVVDTLTKMFT